MSQERGVLRHAKAVALCTLLSRLLGLARDILIAARFATSGVMDAFVLAFTIPNLFRRLFGEGVLSAAFVPVFTEYREKKGQREADRLFSTIFWLASIACLIRFLRLSGTNDHFLSSSSIAPLILIYA